MHTERKHIPMVIGIVFVLLSPAMVFLLPNFMANTLYFRTGSWFVFVPGSVYLIYTISFVLLIVAAFVLYGLSLRKKSIYISAGLTVLAMVGFYTAANSYTLLSDDGITYRPLYTFQTHHYKWNEIDHATFNSVPKEDGKSTFVFSFKDERELQVTVNRLFYKFMAPIESRLSHEGVDVEKVLIPRAQ